MEIIEVNGKVYGIVSDTTRERLTSRKWERFKREWAKVGIEAMSKQFAMLMFLIK